MTVAQNENENQFQYGDADCDDGACAAQVRDFRLKDPHLTSVDAA
jgi:hypothetical protein